VKKNVTLIFTNKSKENKEFRFLVFIKKKIKVLKKTRVKERVEKVFGFWINV
jgi:hypothetical protein